MNIISFLGLFFSLVSLDSAAAGFELVDPEKIVRDFRPLRASQAMMEHRPEGFVVEFPGLKLVALGPGYHSPEEVFEHLLQQFDYGPSYSPEVRDAARLTGERAVQAFQTGKERTLTVLRMCKTSAQYQEFCCKKILPDVLKPMCLSPFFNRARPNQDKHEHGIERARLMAEENYWLFRGLWEALNKGREAARQEPLLARVLTSPQAYGQSLDIILPALKFTMNNLTSFWEDVLHRLNRYVLPEFDMMGLREKIEIEKKMVFSAMLRPTGATCQYDDFLSFFAALIKQGKSMDAFKEFTDLQVVWAKIFMEHRTHEAPQKKKDKKRQEQTIETAEEAAVFLWDNLRCEYEKDLRTLESRLNRFEKLKASQKARLAAKDGTPLEEQRVRRAVVAGLLQEKSAVAAVESPISLAVSEQSEVQKQAEEVRRLELEREAKVQRQIAEEMEMARVKKAQEKEKKKECYAARAVVVAEEDEAADGAESDEPSVTARELSRDNFAVFKKIFSVAPVRYADCINLFPALGLRVRESKFGHKVYGTLRDGTPQMVGLHRPHPFLELHAASQYKIREVLMNMGYSSGSFDSAA